MKPAVFCRLKGMAASPPARGAWIETGGSCVMMGSPSGSPPARGAWIETHQLLDLVGHQAVAPRAGGRGLKH